MCKTSRESIDHLLLHCEVARDFVGFGFLSFCYGLCHAPQRVVEPLASCRGQFGCHHNIEV
jgi:hypothetical protein